jgi:hypothetical protein
MVVTSPAKKQLLPNCCPFCGTHMNRGGCGDRFGTLNCSNCHADYHVEFFGVYPPSEEPFFDLHYREFLGSKPQGIEELRAALEGRRDKSKEGMSGQE